MNPEQSPRSLAELFAERERLTAALKLKGEQTAANIAAGVITEGEPDQDRDDLEAELAEVNAEIVAQDSTDDGHPRLEGI